MADLIAVVIVIGFFALAVAYVKACDFIVGPDADLRSGDDVTVAAVRVDDPGARPIPAIRGE